MVTVDSSADERNPPRALHPTLERALARLAEVDVRDACAEPAPPALLAGIKQFNRGEFFEQHETIEELWMHTPGEIRYLYQGILQVGVGMYHLLNRHNFHGAAVKLDHGARLLAAFPPVCHGIDVARLYVDAENAREHLLQLGPDRLAEFDQQRIPRVHFANEVASA